MPAQLADLPWLTVLIAVPAVAAALIWLVPALRKIARPLGMVVALLVLAGTIVMATGFDPGGSYQFTETYPWMAQLGISWAVGVNGMGLVLILLAVVLVPVVMLASWNEVVLPAGIKAEAAAKALAYRQAGYVALLLLLEAMMIGVFAARDLFLFYILFEA
ncbi:MAG TPA: NADH-quinone oxidoreductase subunit M, partial [Ruania sp.]|nr:NADH-quinone oxidoreductase subunit M [Ruania sp.]